MEHLYRVIYTLVTLWLVEYTDGLKVFTRTDLNGLLGTFNVTSCLGASGNHEEKRYYRYLQKSDKNPNVLYVGAMNNLYKLQLSDMSCLNHVESKADTQAINRCELQGKDKIECQNHIRVVMEIGSTLSVCGTGAYSPQKAIYNDNLESNETGISGSVYCPFDPWDNYTAILTTQGNPGNATVPYFGTFTDFIKSSPKFFRPKFEGLNGVLYPEKTTDNENINWLNSPQFVGSFDDEEKVMFFFRETAVENTGGTNKIYSRVGKVCKQESLSGNVGGTWLSFQKARLICSDFFEEIYDVYETGDQFYALFRKHRLFKEDTEASAVCIYNKTDIEAVFDGRFQTKPKGGTWGPVPDDQNPSPRLDNCEIYRGPTFSPSQTVVKYMLMAQSVQPLYGQQIFMKNIQFINIAVSEPRSHLKTTGRNIYLASDTGEIYDILMKTTGTTSFMLEQKPTVYRPFGLDKDEKHTIWNMQLLDNSLVLGTDYEVARLKLTDLCEQIDTINICITNTLCKWSKCNGGSCVKAETLVSCDIVEPVLDWTNIATKDSIVSIKDYIEQDYEQIPTVGGLYVTLPFKAKISSEDIVWQTWNNCSGRNILENPEKYAISSSWDLIVKNITEEVDNDTEYSVCYMGEETIRLQTYGVTVATDNEEVIKVWKQQFNEWSSAFLKWKGCASSYYDSCTANGGG